jgi:hypothetical protein
MYVGNALMTVLTSSLHPPWFSSLPYHPVSLFDALSKHGCKSTTSTNGDRQTQVDDRKESPFSSDILQSFIKIDLATPNGEHCTLCHIHT